MDNFRIIVTESQFESYWEMEDLVEKLKLKAPQIEWVTEVGNILNFNDVMEEHFIIKVPVAQYEAADYIFRLVKGYVVSYIGVSFNVNPLEDKLDQLADHCSFASEGMEHHEYLSNMSNLLFELYSYGIQLPQGINLHLESEPKEPMDHFPNILFFPIEFLEDELVFQNNINFILSEVSTYLRPLRIKKDPLAPGYVYELFRSFHSLDGVGKRILDTIDLFHSVKSHLLLAPPSIAKKKGDVKSEVTKWIKDLTQQEKESTILETLLKTIQSHKRQYKTCQFCGEKTPPEHRFYSHNCHGSASEQ